MKNGIKSMKTTTKTKTVYRLKNHTTGWYVSCKTLDEARKLAKTAWEWKGKNISITKLETVTKSTVCEI